MNVGRNDPCWCGSGNKYKKCHLHREEAIPFTTQEVLTSARKALQSERLCLDRNASTGTCDGPIVRAHTIQRNGGLSRIARDGYVVWLQSDVAKPLQPQVVGIKLASTFTGFCRKHDCETFAPLETIPFTFAAVQCCLLGYRSVCMELYKKRGFLKELDLMREMDRGRDVPSQVLTQSQIRGFRKGTDAALRELNAYKSIYESMLEKQEFSRMGYYALEFDRQPEIMCSGLFSPETDFQGGNLQDLANVDELAEQLSISVIPTDLGGAAVFAWIKDKRGGMERFIESLDAFPDERILHMLIQLVLETCENTCISPDWWHARNEIEMGKILTRVASLGFDDPHDLMDDGLTVVDWKVLGRHIAFHRS